MIRVLSLLFLSSCANPSGPRRSPKASDNLRPEGSPDIVLFIVSGHSPFAGAFNTPYLQDTGTELARPLRRQLGADVDVRMYADELYTANDHVGFIDLTNGMLEVALTWQLNPATDWEEEFDNPTRAVVVGHSHGVVWAHHAVETSPELLVDVLVDFDGVSAFWEQEDPLTGIGDGWSFAIDDFFNAQGGNPWLHDVRYASGWKIGSDVADIKDIVPDNALGNIEFWADPTLKESLLGAYDREPNVRWDGTTTDIATLQSKEGHRTLYEPGSDAMDTLASFLADLYAESDVLL